MSAPSPEYQAALANMLEQAAKLRDAAMAQIEPINAALRAERDRLQANYDEELAA